MHTKRWSDPTYANLSASAAYTETDTVTATALTPTAVDIDTALYAVGAFVGDWAARLALQPLIPGAVDAIVDSYNKRFETDVLALASSMSNSMGSSSLEFGSDTFVAATAAFRAQAKGSSRKPLMVLSESAKRDLNTDLMANGGSIYATLIGVQLANAVGNTNQGEWVEFGGYMIASTDLVPTVSSGKGNFIVQLSELEYALVLPFSLDPQIKVGLRPENLGTYLIGSHAHGAGIAQQARAYRVISRN
jgi:hypothetical protein